MSIREAVGIIADDLTGANDTALQFFAKGSNTEIIFDTDTYLKTHQNVGTFSVTTETRNMVNPKTAAQTVWENAKKLKENLSVGKFYKKIDSTLRGNIAVETLALLDAIQYDAALIAPAFIQEGRITIGGYQLLRGVPIERTDAARDTYAPINSSYIIDILKKQLNESMYDSIALIGFETVSKGALSIINKLNELIGSGKKLIVADAVSLVDLEQIVLAIDKCKYDILPTGSAGLAYALSTIWLPDAKSENPVVKQIPVLPKLILSGSKNSITVSQINKLQLEDDIENTFFIDLKLDNILNNDYVEISNRIVENFGKDNIIVVHVNKIEEELSSDEKNEKLIDEGITREILADKMTDYLANVAKITNSKRDYILITLGGETSYKCTKAIECGYLQVTDSILPAISLCMDSNAKFVITKSGNMGNANALIDIINYLKNHEIK